MFKRMKIRSLLMSAVLLLSLASCAKEPERSTIDIGEKGTLVKVSMQLRIPSFGDPSGVSRSISAPQTDGSFHVQLVNGEERFETRSSGTTSLYNLWVLQFGSDKNIRIVTKIPNTPAPTKDMVTINADLLTGSDQTIYLVSLGKQYGDVDLSGIKTISELEKYPLNFIKYKNGVATPIIQAEEDIPYRGSQGGLKIVQIEKGGQGLIEYDPTSSFTGAISIYAMVAKVSIDFNYTNTGFTPNLLMLNNVPTSFAINDATYRPSAFVNLPATELKAEDFADGKRYTMSWYMASNPQGTVATIKSEYDRYFYYTAGSTSLGSAPKEGTYIHLWAKKDAAADDYALYYIFLGGNTVNDFNILPHNHYKYRSDINSVDNANDKRIVYKTLVQTIDFAASDKVSIPTSGISLIRTGPVYDFDAHPDMRPMEICALRGTLSVEILTTTSQPITKEDSWLKISSYPNYTEAYNRDIEGDEDGLKTSITKAVTIPGIFKFYLYSDEYEAYSFGTLKPTSRTLYVRITFSTGTTTASKKIYVMKVTQKSGFYIGQFGGEFNEEAGQYEKGLVYESVSEMRSSVQYLSYYTAFVTLLYGSYDASFDELIKEYKVDYYYGKPATMHLATNDKGYTTLKSTYEAPKYIGGKLDLYQYSIQKKNYFAARYCFDKNRDSNGNGVIDPDEYHWYLPAYYQNASIPFNMFGKKTNNAIQSLDFSIMMGTTTQYSKTNYCNLVPANFYTTNENYLNETSQKCVRDIEKTQISASFPTGFKAYAEGNLSVIDAMGMDADVRRNRTQSASSIQREDGRGIRHIATKSNALGTETEGCFTSYRFAVAPYDIDLYGNERKYDKTAGFMTWAEASGFNTTGNTLPLSENLEAAATGCPMYGGKDGSEVGKWRLPTVSEAMVMSMMDAALFKSSKDTGYKLLTFQKTDKNANPNIELPYWTATENSNGAVTLEAYAQFLMYKEDAAGSVTTWKKRIYRQNKTSFAYVRCIKDLPAK